MYFAHHDSATHLEGRLERSGDVGIVVLLLHPAGEGEGVPIGGPCGHRVGPPDGGDILICCGDGGRGGWDGYDMKESSGWWTLWSLNLPRRYLSAPSMYLRDEGHSNGHERREEEGDIQRLLLHLAGLPRAQRGDGEHPPAPAEFFFGWFAH